MQENIGRVWYRSEKTFGRFTWFETGEDFGVIEAWPKSLKFIGAKRNLTIPNVTSIDTVLVRTSWILAIIIGATGGAFSALLSYVQFESRIQSRPDPDFATGAVIGGFIAAVGSVPLIIWLLRRFLALRWAAVSYLDGDGEPQRAYFSRTNLLGGVLGLLPFFHDPFIVRLRESAAWSTVRK